MKFSEPITDPQIKHLIKLHKIETCSNCKKLNDEGRCPDYPAMRNMIPCYHMERKIKIGE